MSFKNILFVAFSLLLIQQSFSQRNYNSYNRLGINGSLTLFDINTSDFVTSQESGVSGGFTTRGSFYNNFSIIFGINYASNNVGIKGNKGIKTQFIDYTIQSAQINVLGSYNVIRHHLSLDFGPILNVNGKMKLKRNGFDDYIIDGYNTLRADEIQDISRINFHLTGGISGGFESFKLSAMYQYGVTNMLNKLNEKDLENTDFEGHSSSIILSAIFYF